MDSKKGKTDNKKSVPAVRKETKDVVQSNTPAELIKVAVSGGADLDKLEKLLDLQVKWEANEAKKAYHRAMTAFKANPPEIIKDKQVAYKEVKYKHASLANVTEQINSALSAHGLSASWQTQQDGAVSVICKITHVLGHSEETKLSAPADNSGSKNSIQAIGSTITYLQRYTLLALTGLATYDQDDDGRASEEEECIDDGQRSTILDYVDNKNVDKKKLCKYLKIESIEKMPKSKYNQAVKVLEAKK